jgi:serine protease
VVNGGGGTLTVDPPADDAAWLNVTPAAVDPATGTGTYYASVTRGGLIEGTYSATITFTSSANTVTVPVIMQVSTQSQSADAGYHYVLLVDQATGTPSYQTSAAASNGVYHYSIGGVAGGTYEVLAGTDLDNDNTICVDGEACGGYISLGQPTPLTVDGDATGVDFTSGFNVIINAGAAATGTTGIIRPSLKQADP